MSLLEIIGRLHVAVEAAEAALASEHAQHVRTVGVLRDVVSGAIPVERVRVEGLDWSVRITAEPPEPPPAASLRLVSPAAAEDPPA